VGCPLPRIRRLTGSIAAAPVAGVVGVTSSVLSSSTPDVGTAQYCRTGVLGVWAAAALPMGVLAWVVAPAVARHGADLVPALVGCPDRRPRLAVGLLMGLYHLHQPWSIPGSIVAGLLMAYPTKRVPQRRARHHRALRPERLHRGHRPGLGAPG
jgi:hypothetical protein